MKTPFQSSSKPARFLGVALSLAASLGTVGVLVMPATAFAAAATSDPAVDQQPLTVQPTVPPNITLMVDDSGSMAWDYMPDWGYLKNSDNNDAVIDAANNGVYYDPTVTYTPPPLADGGTYTNETDMTDVPEDGYGTTSSSTPSLFTYSSNKIAYSTSTTVQVPAVLQYDQTVNATYSRQCVSGSPNWNQQGCRYNNGKKDSGHYVYTLSKGADAVCTDTFNSNNGIAGTLVFTGDHQDGNGNWTDGECKFSYNGTQSQTFNFFQYSTGAAAGPYTVYYVAATAADCANAPTPANCVAMDDTSGTSAPKGVAVSTNVANWFAYYHTRILMAKTGLLTAFSDMSSTYRLGFASINGTAADWIDNNVTDVYDFSTATNSSNRLAEVKPFGDGSATTRKKQFWDWVTSLDPQDGTPLPQALNAVGKYYQTSQPWASTAGDPGYNSSAGATNSPLACRAAYTIMTTDGFWNYQYKSSTVAGASGAKGTTVTGPNNQTYTYTPAAPYSGGGTGINSVASLADVAMYYWETDLQPDSSAGANDGLANEVPTSTEDPAFWQHMTTFTMGLGFTPTGISPSGTTIDQIFSWANGGTAIKNFSWPTPSGSGGNGGSLNNIADLAHAAVNGHGDFFSATSPQAFTSGIKSALNRVSERVGTGASLAANSTSLTTGTVIYQANYYTSVWKGDLKAFAVNSTTGDIATTPIWQASSQMPAAASRTIETYNDSTGKFVAFKNGTSSAPSLSSTQLTALGATTAEQEAIVNYLRGDASAEQKNGGSYRTRDTALGDVVHSQPVYSGVPNPNEFTNQSFLGNITDSVTGTIPFYDWAVGTTTSGSFTASAASHREALIFVASNDGMLHAFNAGTPTYNSTTKSYDYDSGSGAEVYAYLPGAVITAGIKDLSDPDYGQSSDPHQYFNDGQLTIADAYLPSLKQINGSSWHTILVGTSGLGLAKVIYALDITNPASITPLWERSAGDGKTGSDYIGQMVGKPVIAQTDYTPKSGATAASSSWSVLIGNGYNSAQGKAALLQFNLADGSLSVHATDSSTGNGLAAPLAWMDTPTNGVSDIAYAGDVLGRVWSFALNDNTGSNPTPTSTGTLLFTAEDSGGKAQPITAGMLAGVNPTTGDTWLFFGTGQYLSAADLSNTDTQTWYGIIVQSSTASLVSNLANGRSALTERTITGQTSASGTTLAGRSVSTPTTGDMTGKSGWYMDLLAPVGVGKAPVQQGERMIDPNEFQGSILIGVTRIPQVSDVCNPSGTGWIMALDPFTGTAPTNDFFDVNDDGYINSSDRVGGNVAAGVGFSSLPNAPIFVGGAMETSFDNGTNSTINTAGSSGSMSRVSWRELVNP